MSGHKKWADLQSEWFRDDPEAQERLVKARLELDRAWEVLCPQGCCTWWVSPDSNVREDMGGFGPIGCACKAKDGPYCPDNA